MVGPGEGWVHGRSATIKPHPSMWARGCLVRGARNQIPTFRHSLSDVSVFDVPRQMLIIPLSLFHALVGRMIKARHGNPFLNFPPDPRNKHATPREIVIYETHTRQTRRDLLMRSRLPREEIFPRLYSRLCSSRIEWRILWNLYSFVMLVISTWYFL